MTAVHALPHQAERNVAGLASYRSRRGAEIAARLASAARSCGSSVALAVSDKVSECSRPENIWTAVDLHRADGELFDGTGSFAACGSRLCPSCSADLRRRSRRRARAGLASVTLQPGEDFRFVTLTMPTVEGAPLVETIAVVQRAWSLLRKRQFWLSAVRAGIKGVEFTVTAHGYHTHVHFLTVARWIAHAGLRAEWTLCVSKAWAERGRSVTFNTPTGEAVVDVRLVRNRRGSSSKVVSIEAALQEVSKYVTKSESWDAVPDEHLVAIAEVRRWARLFEVFGDMRRAVSEDEPARAGAAVASLDTPYLSDGSPHEPEPGVRAHTLIDVALSVDRLTWLAILSRRFAERRAYRRAALADRYPFAVFKSLAGEVTHGRERLPVPFHRLSFAPVIKR
jgi:hypothetical protein